MVVNRRVEQGIYVVLMLSLEKDHRPLRSTELSSLLSVSDSYLKKILRQLVLADIITSTAGRDGGFQLARSIEKITLSDIYRALEGEECEIKSTGIGKGIFSQDKEFATGEKKVEKAFERANTAFLNELGELPLSELLSKKNYSKGTIDFESMAH